MSKKRLWHRGYGHLNKQSLKKLARKGLVEQFDYDATNDIGFCKACIGGRHHRSHFETSKGILFTQACVGRMKSIGVHLHRQQNSIYPLKTKDQVFDMESTSTIYSRGKNLKTLRSDNGGEYTPKKFEAYL